MPGPFPSAGGSRRLTSDRPEDCSSRDRHHAPCDIAHREAPAGRLPGIAFDVHATPKDLEGAQALAAQNKYQFQWWAVSLVNAVPFGGMKKGADGGIDGHIYHLFSRLSSHAEP